MTPIGSNPRRYILGSSYDDHEVTSLEDPIDVALAHGARALSFLVARQPPPGHCPVCGHTLGSEDVICDRCHEQPQEPPPR